ncbi:MAG: acyl carrier protein [Gemmataceae bacterium]
MNDLDETIIAELRQVAAVRGLTLPAVERRQRLVDDLGLKSLDLAHLIAALERRLKADPFLRLVPITSVRTVGDLCDAYRRYFAEVGKES